jgi:hypothetical protein
MYQVAPPVLGERRRSALAPAPLRLADVLRAEFDEGTCRIDSPELYQYFEDLTGSHGVPFDRELMSRSGNTFISMATALLEDAVTEPVDLVVLAWATPDFDPRLSAPVNLTAVLPGGPLVFATSGQGPLAPFTALRLAGAYAVRHSYERVLVLALDQATMPFRTDPVEAMRPDRDAAVALVLERPGAIEVGCLPGVAEQTLADLIDWDGTVIVGQGVDSALIPAEKVVRAPVGYPCTGLWSTLADHRDGRTILVDYDPVHGDLGVCVVSGD